MENTILRYAITIYKSLVIWQKGESQNGGNKNTKHAKFSEKRTCSCYLRLEIRPFAILPTKYIYRTEILFTEIIPQRLAFKWIVMHNIRITVSQMVL